MAIKKVRAVSDAIGEVCGRLYGVVGKLFYRVKRFVSGRDRDGPG